MNIRTEEVTIADLARDLIREEKYRNFPLEIRKAAFTCAAVMIEAELQRQAGITAMALSIDKLKR